MSKSVPEAAEIARFLSENPEFFIEHEAVFAQLSVPHPQQKGVISLGERQVRSLRERCNTLERQLSGLMQHASGNERLAVLLTHWCADLLQEADAQALPERITQGLAQHFDLPMVALRVWDLPHLAPDHPCAQAVDTAIAEQAKRLEQPWCGPAQDQPAAGLFKTAPASIAILALRIPSSQRCTGVLALGSRDAQRFTTDMGTDLLQLVAQLATAALARLDDAAPAAHPA